MKQLNKKMINSKLTLWMVMVLLVAATTKIYCQEKITTTYYPVASNNRGIINESGKFFTVNTNFQVGRLVGFKYIGYLEFDIHEIPKYAIVNSAKIKLLSDQNGGQITVKHLGNSINFGNPITANSDLYAGGTIIANNYVTTGGNYAISDSEILKIINKVKGSSILCNFGFFPDNETRNIFHSFSLSTKYCYLYVDYTLPAPQKPTNVTVSNVTTNSCNLSWEKPSGDIPVKGYKIYLNETLYSTISSTSINIVGLESSSENSISVRSYNNYGNSEYVTKSVLTLPSAPTNLSASNISCDNLVLNWSVPSGEVSGYKIYGNNVLVKTVENKNTNSIKMDGLNQSSTYSFSIRAYNSTGESINSSVVNIETLGNEYTPMGFNISNITYNSNGSANLRLTWGLPGSDSSFGIEYYKVYFRIGNTLVAKIPSANRYYDLNNLNRGSIYRFSVASFNGSCESNESKIVELDLRKCAISPSKPANITFSAANANSTSGTLTWTCGGVGIYKYEVTVMNSSYNIVDHINTTSESCYLSNVQENYKLLIRAYNNCGFTYSDLFYLRRPNNTTLKSVSKNTIIAKDDLYNCIQAINQFESDVDIQRLELPNDGIDLYPNPIDNTLNIQGDYEKVQIFSSTGNLILDKKKTNNTIDMSYAEAGIYVVKVYTASGVVVKKIVKK